MATSSAVKTQKHDRSKQSLRLWLRLLSCTSMIEMRVRSRLRTDFNITLPQFDVLAELDRAGKAQTMSELSRELMVSNGNVTGVVDRLERLDYVRRVASSTDRRVLYIELTETGQKAFSQMARQHESWINEMLSEMGNNDLLALTDLLNEAKQSVKNHVVEET